MLEFTLRHDLPCTPAKFWEVFFDPELTQTMILEGLGFASCEVDPVQQRGTERHRTMRVTPKINVPGPVAKLLGPKLGYVERGRFSEQDQTWRYDLVLSVLSERIKMGGELRAEPRGDDGCVRVSLLRVEAKILGLGRLVEKAAESNLRDGWDRSAAWMTTALKQAD